MRKDLKKRLEKALITLQEPGGSTIRSIIKVINKDGPVLSLRKVLEALQQGINEGFLCMYNGRVKLKQQIQNERFHEENLDHKNKNQGNKDAQKRKSSNSEKSGTEVDSEDEAEIDFRSKENMAMKKNSNKKIVGNKQGTSGRSSSSAMKNKSKDYLCKRNQKKNSERQKKFLRRYQPESDKAECNSILEMTPNMPEKKTTRPTTEKPDVKKQRGPRCTSMKKDIRMPSKVHIPFVPPSMPQKTNTFNELLRHSPDPVNGPLYDSFIHASKNFSFFGL